MSDSKSEHAPRLTLKYREKGHSRTGVLEATLNGKMRRFHVEEFYDMDELADWLLAEIYECGYIDAMRRFQ